jgi:hypothetical protein
MSAGIFKEAVLGVLFMTIHSWFKNYAKVWLKEHFLQKILQWL